MGRNAMNIASVGRALPRHGYAQEEITAFLREQWSERKSVVDRLEELHRNVRVERRHLALPLEAYPRLERFGQFNDAWIEAALDLGERALRDALARAGLAVRDVDAVFFATVTGVASPSIDARLANRVGLRTDVKRNPLFGLGCVAGAAGIARAADYVRAFPRQVAAVLTVELCSMTWQRDDTSVANLISTGLFGDGAACALVVGSERASAGGPRVLATRSVFYPDTEELMGWEISERGFHIVLSSAVPSVAREQLGADVDTFLADHDLSRADVRSWICHPGGPKVLEGTRDGLGLTDHDVRVAWESLRSTGNLSSASVLLVLRDTMDGARPAPGELGLLLALGPGFCSELVLLQW
jgi:alkylresorcinol/alkylpyrone synthase